MADPFYGEIRMLSFSFPPKGWAACNGQLLPINQNQALFALLGNMYGGDGRVTFALPNLRGRVPVHRADGNLGGLGGQPSVTLTQDELPAHGHLRGTSYQATSGTPVGNVLANAPRRGIAAFATGGPGVILPGSTPFGSSQAHSNMQPYLALQFVIALVGVFPSAV